MANADSDSSLEKPERRFRGPAQAFELNGVWFRPFPLAAKKIGRPLRVLKAWRDHPTHPLQTCRPPSEVIGQDAQIEYVRDDVLAEYISSWGKDGPPPAQRKQRRSK
jgi:hypothetical protein